MYKQKMLQNKVEKILVSRTPGNFQSFFFSSCFTGFLIWSSVIVLIKYLYLEI